MYPWTSSYKLSNPLCLIKQKNSQYIPHIASWSAYPRTYIIVGTKNWDPPPQKKTVQISPEIPNILNGMHFYGRSWKRIQSHEIGSFTGLRVALRSYSY